MFLKKFLLAFYLLFPLLASAQEDSLLTLQGAIQIALEKNYSIRIARQNQQLAENNVTYGNAGFLPIVTANLNRGNNYFQRYIQERVTNLTDSAGSRSVTTVQNFSNNTNTAFNYGVTANWTIFDGMGMFIALNRLEELRDAGDDQAQATVETTIADVSNAYYNVIQLQERVSAFSNALRISDQRLELAKAQYEVGTGSKLNFLAAQVDYNTDKSGLIQQEQGLKNAKVSLNQLLGRTPAMAFSIQDTIIVDTTLDLTALQQEVSQRNPDILIAQRNRTLAVLDRKLVRSERFPQVTIYTGYTHNEQQNRASIFPNSVQSNLINYGVSATFNIFNGFNLNRQIQNAKVVQNIRELELENLKVVVESNLQQTFINYQNALSLIELEQENLKVARQNVEIALERYRLGVSTALELREVQENSVETESRLIQAAYNAKLAEIELLRLSSRIIQ